jgi:hypothetical protein
VLRRVLPLLGVNLVPVGGVFLADWSPATALTLYWCENLLGSLLVAARIALHRTSTGKRGHRRLQLSLHSHNETAERSGRRRKRFANKDGVRGSFLGEFLLVAGAGTVVHGLLLWAILRKLLESGPRSDDLRTGAIAMATMLVGGFLVDLVGIRRRPFAWIRELAQQAANRVTLIHLALIAGFWFGVKQGGITFFGPFVVLKALAEVGTALSHVGVRVDVEQPPGWLTASMNRLRGDGADFAEHWRESREQERRLLARDEEVAS